MDMTCIPGSTLLGGPENMKLLFDSTMALQTQALIDNQVNARRRADNAAAFDHLVSMLSATAMQTGDTQNQQTVSPIKLGAADAQNQQPAGAVYPPIRNVDQGASVANNAIFAQIAALTDVVTKLADALLPVIVNSVGGASTPSQTQAKPVA